MDQFVKSYGNAALESLNTDVRKDPSGPVTSAMPHLLHVHIPVFYTNGRQMVSCPEHCPIREFINHIIRHRPEIKSSRGIIGCVLCQFLMQGDVAAMQILSKLDAEMRCRLFYHSVFRLSYITHRQPCKWRRDNLSVTLT